MPLNYNTVSVLRPPGLQDVARIPIAGASRSCRYRTDNRPGLFLCGRMRRSVRAVSRRGRRCAGGALDPDELRTLKVRRPLTTSNSIVIFFRRLFNFTLNLSITLAFQCTKSLSYGYVSSDAIFGFVYVEADRFLKVV